jgi:hypothetical protein
MITVTDNKNIKQNFEKTAENPSVEKKFKTTYESSSSKKKITDQDKKENTGEMPLPSPLELMRAVPQTTVVVSSLSCKDVEAFFNEMVEAVQHIAGTDKGDSTTTFFLDRANSVFSGTEIRIQEFSTAPKAYNIQLVGTPEAIELFNEHMGALILAFNAEQRPFKINRLETHQRLSLRKKDSDSDIEKKREKDDNSALQLD